MPEYTQPDVFLVASPNLDPSEMGFYLEAVDGGEQLARWASAGIRSSDADKLIEAAGRLCYRSWKPGLNPNVTRVREDKEAYIRNILASGHGSVLEHASFSFIFRHVSRVFTHELVRHRAGTAVSQESLRFVRLTKIPFWMPGWAAEDPELAEECYQVLHVLETHQQWMADHFGLDDEAVPFAEKKAKTSFMRRFAPEGVTTDLMWTCNVRELRHVLETRTAHGAEEEMRRVFRIVGGILKSEVPFLFDDFTVTDGAWVPEYRKV